MASPAPKQPLGAASSGADDDADPFLAIDSSPIEREPRHRYSTFDSQIFALGPNASPAQAKRALEAHLAETDRRMEEAGKLGTALVQQRNELAERLKEVEKLQAEGELSQDLKDRLVEIEKDYNDVARESARAFLPKPRVPSNEAAAGSPFVPEGRSGRRSVSPSKFEAIASPTKLSVPNRKIRNQPANRIHDIEFAAEISQSLIVQVRNLQALLSEKEEEMRDLKIEKSKLEYDAQGFQQRVKSLDESQNKYKDENWSLETQIHELLASQREASDREKKLQQTVNILQSEKNTAQRELDEVKLSHSKLSEELAATVKHHDTEIGAAKRNIVMADSERAALLRKVEDLTGQNQELARAVSSHRGRVSDRPEALGLSDEDFETARDNDTPEHSPPPSPVKGTPRHSLLESETLKTSLHHAQRTIQSLRTNVHREKTEKLELRRMLQDARDELEKVRSDPIANTKRPHKTLSRDFKKPPKLLGALRSARSEIFAEDPNWEDQPDAVTSEQLAYHSRRSVSAFQPVMESIEQDHFDTANETSDQAFETANERETETDDFHTGAEDFSSDEGAETETDSPSKRRTLKGRPPSLPPLGSMHGRSVSVTSTASTEDEYEYEDTRTPTSQIPPLQVRFPLRVSRGANRRSRQASEDPSFQGSPASFVNSGGETPQAAQSLAAELGDFDGSDNESNMSATPSRRSIHLSRPGSIRALTSSPPPPVPLMPRAIMVDSGMVTDPLPEFASASHLGVVSTERPMSMSTVVSLSDYSDAGNLNIEEKLAKFPSPPTSPPKGGLASYTEQADQSTDAHLAELESLKEQHAKEIEKLLAENADNHSAALADLQSAHLRELDGVRSGHADQLQQAAADATAAHAKAIEKLVSENAENHSAALADLQSAHLRELDGLKSGHADKLEQAAADAAAAHAKEIEKLLAENADNHSAALADLQSAHLRELDGLKSGHADKLQQAVADAAAAHARDLENLGTTHAQQSAKLESELKDSHASELSSLKATHAEQLTSSKNDSDVAHAAELAALVAAHMVQIDHAKKELVESHARDLEELKTSHAALVDKTKQTADGAHAQELELLKANHQAQVDDVKNSIAASHERELETLKAAHATQVEQAKKDSEASHAAEIAALAASHKEQLASSEALAATNLAAQLQSLESSHANALNSSKEEAAANLAKELEALKSAHSRELETSKAEAAANLARELENLKVSHSKELSSSKEEWDLNLTKQLDALKAEHIKELEATKSDADARLAGEVESLKAAHSRALESSKAESDAALAREVEALQSTHTKQLESSKADWEASSVREMDAIKSSHAKQLGESKRDHELTLAAELAALAALHAKQLASSKSDADVSLAKEIAALKDSHAQDMDNLRNEHAAAHAKELEGFKAALAKQVESSKSEGDAAHASQIEALKAANAEIVEAHKRDSDKALEQALASAKASHDRDIEALKSDHAASRSKELEELSSKHASEIEAIKTENNAAKAKAIEELTFQHEQHIADIQTSSASSKAKELGDLSASHDRHVETLKAEAAAAKLKELDELSSKHQTQIDTLKAEAAVLKAKELDELRATHQARIDALTAETATSKSRDLDELKAAHEAQIESIKTEANALKLKELEELSASHQSQIDALRAEANADKLKEISELSTSHQSQLEALKTEAAASKARDQDELKATHAVALQSLQTQHESAIAKLMEDLAAKHALTIQDIHTEHDGLKAKELEALNASRDRDLETARSEHAASRAKEVEELESRHATVLAGLRAEHQTALDSALENLKSSHAKDIESLNSSHHDSQESAVAALKSSHAKELEDFKAAHTAASSQAMDTALSEHNKAIEAQHARHLAELEEMVAKHAAELEALRQSLTIPRPTLGYSTLTTVETQPVEEELDIRSPKRDAFIIPREPDQPQTPSGPSSGIFGKKDKRAAALIIAEDETRQSPGASAGPETPESQRPFREMSTNTDARPARKQPTPTADQSSQTSLTADGIDKLLLKHRRRGSQESMGASPFDDGTPATAHHSRSHEIVESPRLIVNDSGFASPPSPVPNRRPGSSSSVRSSHQALPPLPPNHREVIEAARTGSSHGGKAVMGPPLLPASAYKNQAARPRTPRDRPLSPSSARGTPTPRAIRTSSTQGYAEINSPSRPPARSRQSSISSFASEVEARFNIQPGMDAAGFAGPNTDPRMIQAITQTMIGEYLWKYTRKAGRGDFSENRHRRYFWVHPYTRTLYWSDRDPSTAGKSELRAKSVPIEAVRVVNDDNPMPPGLHRKSLIIISPGRTIKFTCTTGQRHETWFNALSYLLLRTGNEGQTDAEELAGTFTQEDVDEFNPQLGHRITNGTRRGPPSLSSYNSRGTRTESPNLDISVDIPTLTPTHERGTPKAGTLGRLSGYWRSNSANSGIFNSLRARSTQTSRATASAIYEASEVNDSAEELRQIMEQQDQESGRLENVRACCDGKHDVGTLSRSTKRNRHTHTHTHTHTHPGQSASPTPTPIGTISG